MLFSSRYQLDADGLPRNEDLVHARLKEMESIHSAQLKKLTVRLQKATVTVTNSMVQAQNIEDELDECQFEKEVS